MKQTLIRSYPGLQVVGTLTPPFRPLSPEEDDAVIAQINAAKPDIVWVGLSTPKQEFWMAPASRAPRARFGRDVQRRRGELAFQPELAQVAEADRAELLDHALFYVGELS